MFIVLIVVCLTLSVLKLLLPFLVSKKEEWDRYQFEILKPDCPLPTAMVPDDSHWSAVVPDSSWDGWEQSSQYLDTIALDSKGRLYVAGPFDQIGGLKTNEVAYWDSEEGAWHTMGNGLLSLSGPYYSLHLVVDAQDRVYISGKFNMAGDQIVNGIAMWDGQAWHALGGGLMDGKVNSMLLDGQGNLYIAGDFSQVGSAEAMRIARWNGQDWDDLSAMNQKLEKLLATNPDQIKALAYDSTKRILYARGVYRAGNTQKDFTAAWREGDQSWALLDSFVRPAGNFYRIFTKGSVVHDPGYWQALPGSLMMKLQNRRNDPNDPDFIRNRDAVATDLAQRQDGKFILGGQFDSINGRCFHGVAAWDGAAWSPLGSGVSTENHIGAYTPAVQSLALDVHGNLYVAGSFREAGSKPIRFLARWTP
jgi:hypothetical protein